MRSIEETQSRWQATQSNSATLADLRRAVKFNSSSSPCLSGCRSVCWKAFLLSSDGDILDLPQVVLQARENYQERRDHFLKFIKHPEALTELTIDPLADDPESPWNTVRQDEIIRAEILQDVQRLPDEANYHNPRVQTMILDILFVYCKLNPSGGGYRQGMHELLAPMVHVVEQDSVDRATVAESSSLDVNMLDMLDSSFIEHDAYALFHHLMTKAQSFYEVKDVASQPPVTPSAPRFQEQASAIVERSKFIHEVCLEKIDPELAAHLTNIEILPQIFLIRWVRLLYSREFPFSQFLVLWDTIFAIDPSLDLIDLVCCAMLIRIRWQLLEADYSVCLQLLLKYPPPSHEHGPHTFVDDALYLRDHLDTAGGASIIKKYTGKTPTVPTPGEGAQSLNPPLRGPNSRRERSLGSRLPTTSRSIGSSQVNVEALLQGAAKGAKGVIERGEKLGINQAVRDAVGEIRRNMQGFNDARYSPRLALAGTTGDGASKTLAAMATRNKQLAALLNETVSNLKTLSTSSLDDKAKSMELIEVAAAKVQFVQIYLEDSTMELPTVEHEEATAEPPVEEPKKKAIAVNIDKPTAAKSEPTSVEPAESSVSKPTLSDEDASQNKNEAVIAPTSPGPGAIDNSDSGTLKDPLEGAVAPSRPAAVPTRSTLAQSSFSWMLEPDETTQAPKSPPANGKTPGTLHKKKNSNNASRERNAFLFGEITADEVTDSSRVGQMFGMEPIQKTKET